MSHNLQTYCHRLLSCYLLFSIHFSLIHLHILLLTSALKQWKTSKRNFTVLRYNVQCTTLFPGLLVITFFPFQGQQTIFDIVLTIYSFLKARYQNAEEVLKLR